MQSYKKVLAGVAVTLSLSAAPPLASAAEVGLGVTMLGSEGGYGVFLPIRLSKITIEPEFYVYRSEADQAYPLNPANDRTSDYENMNIGTGVYLRRQLAPSTEYYLGGRVGYTKYKSTYSYPNTPSSSTASKEDGYYLGPVIGAEYFFNKNFSLGLEAAFIYSSVSQDYASSPANSYTQDRTSWTTDTRAKLRVYF
jgi:hypothetical protein